MNSDAQDVRAYYDSQTSRKIKNFTEGNRRVNMALRSLMRFAPDDPKRILEIGCGIGSVCWYMGQEWPNAQITGIDISPKSVELAIKVFGSKNIEFIEGAFSPEVTSKKYNLIVLMDVYEHVPLVDRPFLHKALHEARDSLGIIFLSFPTPAHLNWLRVHKPTEIQPVDEDVTLQMVAQLAEDTDTEIMYYEEIDIWRKRDYAHVVLGPHNQMTFPCQQNAAKSADLPQKKQTTIGKFKKYILKQLFQTSPSWKRREWVRGRLGDDVYRSIFER